MGKPVGKFGARCIKPQRKKRNKMKAVDPFYKGQRTNDKKAAFANQAPSKHDEALCLPHRAQEFAKRKEAAMSNVKKPRNKFKKDKDSSIDSLYAKEERGAHRPLKAVPEFKQGPRESDDNFCYRMDRETQALINMTEFANKFDVDLQNIHEEPSDKKKTTKKTTDTSGEDEKKGSNKKRRRNQKKAEKKKKQNESKLWDKIDNFEEFEDKIEFGEVALAPPTLTAKPRNITTKSSRPGTKSLMLKSIVNPSESPKRSKAKDERHIGKSRKRKHMSAAEKRITDKEQERAIELYRQLKKQKTGNR